MSARRYTVVIADRSSGVVRHLTVNLRTTVLGVRRRAGAADPHGARRQVERPRGDRPAARRERAAPGRERQLPRRHRRADHADSVARNRHQRPRRPRAARSGAGARDAEAAGGREGARRRRQPRRREPGDRRASRPPRMSSPEDTFGVLRDLLQGLESRLRYVRRDVERREALAGATPSIWPAHGWLTGTFGGRADPFTGERGFHQGSTSRPTRASRSTRPPTAPSTRPRTPATTAT